MQVEEENRLLELKLREKVMVITRTDGRVQEILDKVDTASLFSPVLYAR
jgi:hypothetical protein